MSRVTAGLLIFLIIFILTPVNTKMLAPPPASCQYEDPSSAELRDFETRNSVVYISVLNHDDEIISTYEHELEQSPCEGIYLIPEDPNYSSVIFNNLIQLENIAQAGQELDMSLKIVDGELVKANNVYHPSNQSLIAKNSGYRITGDTRHNRIYNLSVYYPIDEQINEYQEFDKLNWSNVLDSTFPPMSFHWVEAVLSQDQNYLFFSAYLNPFPHVQDEFEDMAGWYTFRIDLRSNELFMVEIPTSQNLRLVEPRSGDYIYTYNLNFGNSTLNYYNVSNGELLQSFTIDETIAQVYDLKDRDHVLTLDGKNLQVTNNGLQLYSEDPLITMNDQYKVVMSLKNPEFDLPPSVFPIAVLIVLLVVFRRSIKFGGTK